MWTTKRYLHHLNFCVAESFSLSRAEFPIASLDTSCFSLLTYIAHRIIHIRCTHPTVRCNRGEIFNDTVHIAARSFSFSRERANAGKSILVLIVRIYVYVCIYTYVCIRARASHGRFALFCKRWISRRSDFFIYAWSQMRSLSSFSSLLITESCISHEGAQATAVLIAIGVVIWMV